MAGTTLLLAAAAQAQSADKMYLDVRAGVALPQDAAIKDAFLGNGGNLSFDAGLHAGVNLGYNFCQSLAAELETGVVWNSINSIQGNSLSTGSASADLYQIPVLMNVIYKPWHGAFVPYFGVGIGGVAAIFNGSNIPGSFFPGSSPDFSDMDFVFAYQATAGFKYSVSEHIDLGLAYQFLGTDGPSWSDNNVTLSTDGVLTHSIMATFTWRF